MTAATKAALAGDRLTRALVDWARRGVRPGCVDYAYLFLSEDPRERRVAAAMCNGCCVFTECDEVGRFQRFGVFAGTDRTRPRQVGQQT
jgi:hypothetical protein